jgi:hypothetical protein
MDLASTRSNDLLAAFAQQGQNVLQMCVLRWVNTGDRVFDTAVGMLINALIAWAMAVCSGLAPIRKIREVASSIGRLLRGCLCRRRHVAMKSISNAVHDPTDIDVMRFFPKPLNSYRYAVSFSTTSSISMVSRWIITTHQSRMRTTTPFALTAYKEKTGFTFSDQLQPGDRRFDDHYITNIALVNMQPIWVAPNRITHVIAGYSIESGYFKMYCDDLEVLRTCLLHISNEDTRLLEHASINKNDEEKANRVQRVSKIYQHTPYRGLGSINQKRCFDTLFFRQKQELLDLLTKFKDGNLYPAHMAIDSKLGLLLHGPPGTGKSACILAMANYLQRDVLLVDMKALNTKAELDTVFRPELRDERFTLHNTIIVLEEIDVLLGVLGSRDTCGTSGGPAGTGGAASGNNENKEAQCIADKLLELSLKATEKKERDRLFDEYKKAKSEVSTRIDLAYLLLKLDGLESAEGRCIVATTNHPGKLDPALLRPGRFDYKLLLSFATPEDIADMLQYIFQTTDKERGEIMSMDLPKDTWTPAEVQAVAITQTSARAAAEKLRRRWPRPPDIKVPPTED